MKVKKTTHISRKKNKPATSSRRIMSAAKPENLRTTCTCERICPMMPQKMNTPVRTAKNCALYTRGSEITYYECESCDHCPLKKQCTRAKGNRKLSLSKTFLRQREESRQRIMSPDGVLLRMNRSIQAEGAFGVIKQDYGFRQFLLRGNKMVKTEMHLMAISFNINKLHNKIQANRTGSQLFEKLTA